MIRLLSTSSKAAINGVKNIPTTTKLPKLATFDLDHTVWPFGIDGFPHVPPYYFYEGKLIDTNSKEIKHFPDFPKIFQLLKEKNIKIAVASRTKYPSGAYRLIELFDWNKYIDYYHIYPGQKMKHFERIKQESGIDYEDMVFFDDEQRNIDDVGQMGVMAILVDQETGATESVVLETLNKFATNKKNGPTTDQQEEEKENTSK